MPLPPGLGEATADGRRRSAWCPSRCLQPGVSSPASPDSADRVAGLSGAPVRLQPPSALTRADSLEWKVQLHTEPECRVILTWKNTSGSSVTWVSNRFNDRLSFMNDSLSLLINATQQQDSGLYLLEVTKEDGSVQKHRFQISVFGECPRWLPRCPPSGLAFPAPS